MARGVNTKANGIDFRANRFDEFLKLIPQNLTDAEKAQVMANLGITPTPGSLDGAVRYDAAQTLTDEQKQQAQENAGVDLDDKANIDGYYSQLTAGAAENLVGGNETSREFTCDTAGGTADISDGIVQVERIKGNIIVWNQILPIVSWNYVYRGVSIISNGDGSFTINGIATATGYSVTYRFTSASVIKNHKYFMFVSNTDLNVGLVSTNITGGSTRTKHIFTAGSTGLPYYAIQVIKDTVYKNVIIKPQLYDLTRMFGAGNEPATVEEFKKMFPLDYYYENEGQLLSLNSTGIKTVGFNQYNHNDPHINVFKQAYYIGGTYTSLWFSKSKTDTATAYVFGDALTAGSFYTNGGTHYKANASAGAYNSSKTYAVGAYCIESSVVYTCNTAITAAEAFDASKWTSLVDVAGMVADGILTSVEITPVDHLFTPAEQGYVHVEGGNATDTVVNLHWSGKRDGDYEPYWQSTRNIDIASIKDGEGNTLFSDGLCSVGSVHDEVTSTKAIKRIAKQTITGAIGDEITLVGCNLSATEYKSVSDYGTLANGVITLTASVTNEDVLYKLATPIEITFAEPLNLTYRVSDFGTETLLPINTATPVTTPIRLDVIYGLNVVDFVRNADKNYLTIEDSTGDNGSSFTNLRSALSTAFGIDIVPAYDSINKRYTFAISDNRKVEVPESATSSGTKGTCAEDATSVYFCTDTDTWVKINKETW